MREKRAVNGLQNESLFLLRGQGHKWEITNLFQVREALQRRVRSEVVASSSVAISSSVGCAGRVTIYTMVECFFHGDLVEARCRRWRTQEFGDFQGWGTGHTLRVDSSMLLDVGAGDFTTVKCHVVVHGEVLAPKGQLGNEKRKANYVKIYRKVFFLVSLYAIEEWLNWRGNERAIP